MERDLRIKISLSFCALFILVCVLNFRGGEAEEASLKFQMERTEPNYFLKQGVLPDGTFYQEVIVENPEYAVLLLHGAAFSSKTWHDLGTLDILGENNIAAVAIDIPHFGRSKSLDPVSNPIDYLDSLILNFTTLKTKKLIIISPSMSGRISLPYLVNRESEIDGFIAVAPVGANIPSFVDKYHKVEVPTLIYYGERDLVLGKKGADSLSKIPNSNVVVVPDGSHPCYNDNPELWHKTIIDFIQSI